MQTDADPFAAGPHHGTFHGANVDMVFGKYFFECIHRFVAAQYDAVDGTLALHTIFEIS